MNELVLLDNRPRRRRRAKRNTGRHQRAVGYWQNKRRRHRPAKRAGAMRLVISKIPQSKGTTMAHRKHTRRLRHHRRFRHNPPAFLKKIGGNIGGKLTGAAGGAVTIAANKFIANKLVSLMGGVTGSGVMNKQLVELASALFLIPPLARATKLRMFEQGAMCAAAVALYDAGKSYLPASVQAQLSGYEFPQLTQANPARNDLGLSIPGHQGGSYGSLPIPASAF